MLEKRIGDKLDGLLEEALEEYALPGIAASVSGGGGGKKFGAGFAWRGAAGRDSVENGRKLTPDHIFHMASVTKLFVGTAAVQLWERGLLAPEDRLADRLPEYRQAPRGLGDVTLLQLLTHTSGLSNVEHFGWDEPETDDGALRRYAVSPEVMAMPFVHEDRGNIFSYSDVGYEILGAVIEETAGETLEDYIKTNIFEPLGMERSTLRTFERGFQLREFAGLESGDWRSQGKTDELRRLLDLRNLARLSDPPMAMPHGRTEEGKLKLEAHYPYNREHCASSTLSSCQEDMERFARAHLSHACGGHGPQLFPPAYYEEVWRPRAVVPNNGEHIGLSWFIREQEGYTLYGHEGTDQGFRASFWICPELDLTLLVNSNVTKAPVKRVAKRLLKAVLESC